MLAFHGPNKRAAILLPAPCTYVRVGVVKRKPYQQFNTNGSGVYVERMTTNVKDNITFQNFCPIFL